MWTLILALSPFTLVPFRTLNFSLLIFYSVFSPLFCFFFNHLRHLHPTTSKILEKENSHVQSWSSGNSLARLSLLSSFIYHLMFPIMFILCFSVLLLSLCIAFLYCFYFCIAFITVFLYCFYHFIYNFSLTLEYKLHEESLYSYPYSQGLVIGIQ